MRLLITSVLAIVASAGLGLAVSPAATGTVDSTAIPNDLNGSNFTYPFPTRLFRFTSQLQKLEMAFMDVQPTCAPNGQTVVLLHGKNFCGPTWEETIRTLAGVGYRVIAPDQIGFCKSSKPDIYQFSLNQLAYNTRGLLNALRIANVTVMGHSLGGMLATRFALQYPETVSEMVLVDPVGLEDYVQEGVPYISIDDSYLQEANSTYESIKAYEKKFYYINEWRETYDVWVRMLVNIYNGSKRESFLRCQARIVDIVLTSPVAQYFGDVQPRTLLIVGDKDRTAIGAQWAPKEVAERLGRFDLLGPKVVSQLPHGTLHRFADLGHAPQLSDPTRFHRVVLDWLHI